MGRQPSNFAKRSRRAAAAPTPPQGEDEARLAPGPLDAHTPPREGREHQAAEALGVRSGRGRVRDLGHEGGVVREGAVHEALARIAGGAEDVPVADRGPQQPRAPQGAANLPKRLGESDVEHQVGEGPPRPGAPPRARHGVKALDDEPGVGVGLRQEADQVRVVDVAVHEPRLAHELEEGVLATGGDLHGPRDDPALVRVCAEGHHQFPHHSVEAAPEVDEKDHA